MGLEVKHRIFIGGSPSPDTYNPLDSFNKIFGVRGFKIVAPQAKKKMKNEDPDPGSYFVKYTPKAISRVPTLKGRLKNNCIKVYNYRFCD